MKCASIFEMCHIIKCNTNVQNKPIYTVYKNKNKPSLHLIIILYIYKYVITTDGR